MNRSALSRRTGSTARLGDAQVGWNLPFADRHFMLTLGVNNVLCKRAPDCLSCGGFDPTTYDLPDQFGYVRLGAKF